MKEMRIFAVMCLAGCNQNKPMKTKIWKAVVQALVAAVLFLCATGATAQVPSFAYDGPTNQPIGSWSFQDPIGWTDDYGDAPMSFNNINYSYLGDGSTLEIGTNVPAWLDYSIYEPDTGATNLMVDGPGSLTLWYAPQWATTNGGPGEWSQLIDVGEWTNDASIGYWGLSVDPPGSNLWFTVQDGLGDTYALSTPISWVPDYFHFIALTYSSTNVSIYLDGVLATNDPGGLSIWPDPVVISNSGVFFGSDANGNAQAQGLFNTVQAYDYPLDTNDIQTIFNYYYGWYLINPMDNVMFNIVSAPSSPSTNYYAYDIITGTGNLQLIGSVTPISSTNVWITNVVATVSGSGTNNMSLQFTIQGGFDGFPYDTFVNSVLNFSSNTNLAWAWMGQGFHGNTYRISNLPNTACFLILGTPQDSDGDGLTDAYELLVSKTNPYNASTSGDGISDSDKILQGLNPLGYYPQWKMDSDNDCLPDAYESATSGLNPNYAEPPPGLPSFSAAPVP